MNRIYKVIWNEALSCFTAVGEYAKGRGKSSKSSVNSNATINTTSNLASVNKLRLSAIGLGLLAAGFGMQTNATGTDNHHEGNYSHSHGSHGVHSHSPGNNSHNNNSNSGGSGGSIALKFEGDNATTVTRSDGETLNILGGATGPLTNGNIGVFGTGDTLTIKLAQNIDLGTDGSLKTGDTLVDNSGIKITASSVANNVVLSSSGLNNGNNKVINVANGLINASSKDAVNGSQLHSLTNTVAANKTKYYSVNSTATGNANNDGATGPNAMAMGGNATATGGQAIAIGSGESGQNTVASGQQSIAIGANVVSKGASSIAIGGDDLDDASKANINGTSASTLNGGDVNTTFFSYTGRDLVETPRYKVNTESGGAASIAIGAKSLSEGALSTAIGIQSSSSGVASSAFGIGASASEKGSVALGAGSVANVAGGAVGYVPTGASMGATTAITATQSGADYGAVSVGSSIEGGARQIVNVAAGSQDSDAVNVAQLKALDTIVAGIDFPIRSSSTQPYTTSVTGIDVLAVGSNANANGSNSTVIGENAFGNASATVIGEGARSSFNGFAGGQDAKAGVNSVAIGQRATNGTASRAVAIGYEAKATAQDTIALGLDAQAQALGGVALGKGSRVNALNSVALGQNSVATVQSGASFLTNVAADANNGTVSVGAVGSERRIINVADGSADTDAVNVAQLKALDTIVAGIDFPIRSSSTQPYTTSVTGNDALAVGANANANGDSSTAVGENAFANGIQASAFGAGAEATARSSLASGFEAKAKGGESVALGVKSSAEGLGATAVGPTASARGEDSAALGRRSRADGDGALVLGGFSKAVGANASAVGFKAEATNKNATAIGVNAKALGERSVALGEGAQATTLTGTAIGSRTLASAVQSTAVGVGSKATKQWATAMGFSSDANGVSSVALGDRSVVDGKESIAIGKGNTVSGANSIAIGTENNVTGNNSGAFGDPNTITGSGSYVMGNDNTVGNDNTFVLGNGVKTTQDNSIVLGNLSTDRAATTETGIIINGTPYTYAGSAPVGVMSVGSVGNERQIINVAAGAVNATSTDAVNGSQLHATNEAVESNTTTINKGFGLKAADGYVVQKSLGQAVEVVGSNDNIDTRVRNGKIEVKLNNDLDLGSNGSISTGNIFSGTQVNRLGMVTGGLAMGGVTTVSGLGVTVTGTNPLSNATLTSDGLSMFNGPSITKSNGINAGNKRVVNVDDGIQAKDAVNVSQLNSSTAAAKTEVVAGTNVADVVKSTGDNGQDVYTVNAKGSKTSAGSAAVTVSAATDTTNLTDYAVDLSQDTKDSLIKADNSVQYDNLAKTSVTLGGMGSTSPVTLTNVAAGDISEASTDAVNGSQLFETNTKVNQGFGLKAADGQTVMKQLGEQVEVVGSNDNIDTRVRNGKIEVKLNNDLDLGSNGSVKMGSSFPFGLGRTTTLDRSGLTTGNSLLNTTVDGLGVRTGNALVNTRVSSLGVTVSNPFSTTVLSSSGLNIVGGPSVTTTGINAGNKRVVNVDNGIQAKDAVNVSQLNSASAAARTKVIKGTNVSSVDFSTDSITGQDVYTVNADGVTASAGSAAVTVTAGDKDEATNVTDYAVDLSESSKASLVKADSAMQTVITQIDGQNVKTLDKTDNTANFLTGDNIVLTAEDNGIKVSTKDKVAFTEVTTGNTLVNTGGVSFLEGSTVRLSSTGLDNGGNQIKGVAAGVLDSDAVNFGQLQATTTTVDKGLNFGGDSGTDVNRKLGQKLTVKGGDTIDADPATKNISVTANGADTLTVRLAKDINLGDTGSVTTGNTQVNNAGITLYNGDNNQVALTNNGLNNGNNKITNVADGLLSTTSQDAVNGRQLFETNENIAKGIKIGDGNSANDQQFALGDTINVTGDSNLTTVASATGVQVRLNNQLDLGDDGRMQIGDSIMNSTGFTFVDNGLGRTVLLSSRGLDNGGNPIRNVGKGTLDTDAVNVGQLNEVAVALDQGWGITAQGDVATMVRQGSTVDMNSKDGNIKVSRTLVNNAAIGASAAAVPAGPNDISFDLNPDISVVSVTAGDTTINDNGLTIAGGPSVTKSGIDAADNKITNVQNGAVTAGSQDAINGGQLYAQGSGISSIIGGNTVYNPLDGTFTNSNIGGTGQGNIDGAIASIRQGTIAINENVQNNTTAITTNTTNIATNTTNISTNTTNIAANKDRLDAGLNFGADSGANINKPVGDASVLSFTGGNNITTTAEGSSIKFDLNGNINVDSVTAGTTVINSNGISMQDGPSMTAQGLYAGNQRMTGVADGVEARDAVNFGQLDAVSRRLGDNMNQLGYKIGEVEDDANAGISAAMAMSSLPQAYISGKSMIGGGVGTYNGESAVAIGFSKLSNDGRWVMKLSGTADTQGNAGASIGAGFHFD
ncbi:YadA-like family protein [Psychrobacter namhaensis]|uniref:YadA-like family protein n=1 Tax=Psychrobacter namhaensis TaxID=292734 RepID=UPI001918250C|nr:YadA-like family protein [Psychrobacter namhaensis]